MKILFFYLTVVCITSHLASSLNVTSDYDQHSTQNKSTFKFPNVEVNKLDSFTSEDLLSRLRGQKFYDAEHDKVLMHSTAKPNLTRPYLGNGLLGTIYQAYSWHIPLTLRPDDLWLAIIFNFGRYVKSHSEQMRSLFVDHLGRKQLLVRVASPYLHYTTEKHWEEFVDLMADQIKKNTKNEVVDWMIPTFSTTTQKDRMVAQVALMSTVNDYFQMKFILLCGFSEITLEGTLEDWQQLYNKTQGLYKFGVKELSDWADLLLPVLNEFISAYQGKVNEDFWERAVTSERRGSGGQETFRGWFLVFSPFNSKGEYQLRPLEEVQKDKIYAVIDDDDICDCGLDVQVLVDDHGIKEYQVVFYGGLLMTHYDIEKNMLSPAVDWIMIEKKEITYDDLKKSLERKLSGEKDKKKLQMSHKLLQFAYDVAIEALFPNEVLMELVEIVSRYYYNKLILPEYQNCEAFLKFLAEPDHIWTQNRLAKYIDPARIPEFLKLGPTTLLPSHSVDL